MAKSNLMIGLLDNGLLVRHIKKYIRDPIHDYIPISEIEERIVDKNFFQRLRRIYQLQVAYSVYPGATHTRFLHSLGVMHLAGKFLLALLRKTYSYESQNVSNGRYYAPSLSEIGIDSYQELVTYLYAARMGGLLHDVGHMPFSHAFDEEIIDNSSKIRSAGIHSHEDTGYYLFKNFISEDIKDAVESSRFSEFIDGELLVDAVDYILKPHEFISSNKPEIYSILRSIIKEFLYPADILDFCMRDAYFAGAVEYGRIDTDRIFTFSLILQEKGDEQTAHIGLLRKALGALRAYLYSRIWLFNNVYFHKFSRLMDYTVKELMRGIYREGLVDFESILVGLTKGDPEALKMFARMDDGYVLYKALESRNKRLEELAKMVLFRKPIVREVYSLEITISTADVSKIGETKESFADVLERLRKTIAESLMIDIDSVIIDSPPIKFFPLNPYLPARRFPLIDAKNYELVSVTEADAWEIASAQIFDLSILRVLVKTDALAKISLSLGDIRNKITRIVDDMRDVLKLAFIQKYSKATYTVTM